MRDGDGQAWLAKCTEQREVLRVRGSWEARYGMAIGRAVEHEMHDLGSLFSTSRSSGLGSCLSAVRCRTATEKSEACPVVALLPEHDGEHVYSSSSPRRAARAYHPRLASQGSGPPLCAMRRWHQPPASPDCDSKQSVFEAKCKAVCPLSLSRQDRRAQHRTLDGDWLPVGAWLQAEQQRRVHLVGENAP